MSLPCCKELWSHPGKPLKEHLERVGLIAKYFADAIPLRFINKTFFRDIIHLIGLYHDIGKATPFFQNYLKEDPNDKALLRNMPETRHSLISAIAVYFAIEELFKTRDLIDKFISFLPFAAFLAVRRHHTNLQSALEDLRLENENAMKKQVEGLYYEYLSFLPFWDTVYRKLKTLPDSWPLKKITLSRRLKENQGVLPYLIQHLLYSILLDADKHEVTMGSHLERKSFPVDMVEVYRQERGFNKPQREIDVIRDEIYQRVIKNIENLDLNKDRILSLSAPTGSGKTLTSLSFAIRLREKIMNEHGYCPRIIYCLPFLSIIDQNAKIIEEVFKTGINRIPTSDLFLIHHHLSDYAYRVEDNEFGTDASEVLIEGWDSEIIITTFVQLFHTLFSNQNRVIRKFHKIAGSIIIFDEIQSFPHKYWLLFKETAEAMQKYLNTYFILSTATQPAIFDNAKELLSDKEKYFKSLKRTKVIIKKSSKTVAELANELLKSLTENAKSILVVLNTVQSAEKFFAAVKEPLEKMGYKVYFLSSHITPYERLERIEKIKESIDRMVVVSTQLVEAGVDIDLEKVIRDFGPMDSINQAAGRANRNQKRNSGEIEVVILNDEKAQRPFYSYIYDPVLIDNTKRILEVRSVVNEEDFLALTTKYYEQILKALSDHISQDYLEAVKMLDYEKIGRFELIEEGGEKIDIFIEINNEAIEIWNQYQDAIKIAEPMKRKQRLLEIRGKFYRYVISVLISKARENLPPEVSGIRFVSKSQINEYYDSETGFKAKGESAIW